MSGSGSGNKAGYRHSAKGVAGASERVALFVARIESGMAAFSDLITGTLDSMYFEDFQVLKLIRMHSYAYSSS